MPSIAQCSLCFWLQHPDGAWGRLSTAVLIPESRAGAAPPQPHSQIIAGSLHPSLTGTRLLL